MQINNKTILIGMGKKRINLIYLENHWLGPGLAGWSWLEHHPMHPKVAGLIPSQGTYIGCRFDPWLQARARGNQSMFLSHIDVSLSLSPFLPLKSINISSGEDIKQNQQTNKSLTGSCETKNKDARIKESWPLKHGPSERTCPEGLLMWRKGKLFQTGTKGLSLVKICSQMIKIAMWAMMALHENRKKS